MNAYRITARETISGRVLEEMTAPDEWEAETVREVLEARWRGVEVTVRESEMPAWVACHAEDAGRIDGHTAWGTIAQHDSMTGLADLVVHSPEGRAAFGPGGDGRIMALPSTGARPPTDAELELWSGVLAMADWPGAS